VGYKLTLDEKIRAICVGKNSSVVGELSINFGLKSGRFVCARPSRQSLANGYGSRSRLDCETKDIALLQRAAVIWKGMPFTMNATFRIHQHNASNISVEHGMCHEEAILPLSA
jgi:hypothetical protein